VTLCFAVGAMEGQGFRKWAAACNVRD